MMKFDFTSPDHNLSYDELLRKYEDAMEIIYGQQIKIGKLYQEIDNYCQAYEALMDELSEYR